MRRGGKTTYAILPPPVTQTVDQSLDDEYEVKPRSHCQYTINDTSHLHRMILDHDRDEEYEQSGDASENDPTTAAAADVAEVLDL